jgi:hypothetical protein
VQTGKVDAELQAGAVSEHCRIGLKTGQDKQPPMIRPTDESQRMISLI